MRRFSATLLLFLALFLPFTSQAANEYTVAVISDGPYQHENVIENILVQEMLALAEGEFALTVERLEADWTQQGISRVLEKAYSDPSIDIVLVAGIAANQITVARDSFAKPTFLPVVFDIELMGAPLKGKSSGKKNLNYMASGLAFNQHLDNFSRIAPLKKIALLGDQLVFDSIPEVIEYSKTLTQAEGIEMYFIGDDGSSDDLAARLHDDTDGVMYAAFPRMSDVDFEAMIEAVNDKGLPSFSLLGSEHVARGMLMADQPGTDWQRLARRNALNMQAVMLGERTADQPVLFEIRQELTINMETARNIGLSPSFDLLSEAVLLNETPADKGTLYTLASVAQLAVERNLSLQAESFSVLAGREDIRNARSNLLPQLSLGSSYTQRKKSALVQAGQFAEKTTDGSLSLNQLIYADSSWANTTIQRHLQHSREVAFEQSRLEIIQTATVAFLNVLRAQTQLRVRQDNLNLTKTNLELARDRVRVGSSSAADVYRWESQIASDRSSLLQASATLKQARENLNRILNRPINETFRLGSVDKGDPFPMSTDEFDDLVNNARTFSYFTDYVIDRAYRLAPELTQLEAQIAAKQREKTSQTRAFWLPDFSLTGRYGENFDQSGLGVGPTENQADWQVAFNANLALFDGGARRAALSQTGFELKQLSALFDATKEQVEQRIRAALHASWASYNTIELSAQAAEAGRKNLELVTDSYGKGVVSVIELLDAQNASLQADEAAANSVYDFLIDVMEMQRAMGEYDFLFPAQEQEDLAEHLRDYLKQRQLQDK